MRIMRGFIGFDSSLIQEPIPSSLLLESTIRGSYSNSLSPPGPDVP